MRDIFAISEYIIDADRLVLGDSDSDVPPVCGWEGLAYAVCRLALSDYVVGLRELRRVPATEKGQLRRRLLEEDIAELERFIRDHICRYVCELSGDALIRGLRRAVQRELCGGGECDLRQVRLNNSANT